MKLKSFLLTCILFCGSKGLAVSHLDYSASETAAPAENRGADWDGGYILNIGLGRPAFSSLDKYDKIYGSPNLFPSFSVTYKFVDFSFLTFGVGGRLSYYAANGHPLKVVNGEYVSDTSSSTLKLVPYEFYLLAHLKPFHRHYVVADFWMGYEELYYEEVRLLVNPPSTTTTSTGTTTKSPKSPNEINSGWNKSITLGMSLNFMVNYFDDATAKALEATTGLRFIYISPFVEYANAMKGGYLYLNQQKASNVDFSRTTYGIMFTFET